MSALSIGSMNQLGDALEKAGFTVGDITRLRSNPDFLEQIRRTIKSSWHDAKEMAIRCVIDGDADPYIPSGMDWEVKEHRKCGKIEWNPSQTVPYFFPEKIEGEGKLLKELDKLREQGLIVLNTGVLGYLLKHFDLIPEEWKKYRQILFLGTIYKRGHQGLFFVSYLIQADAGRRWWCVSVGEYNNHYTLTNDLPIAVYRQ